MNFSLKDISGSVLQLVNLLLYANAKKGNRPSFIDAAKPDVAIPLYDLILSRAEKKSTC